MICLVKLNVHASLFFYLDSSIQRCHLFFFLPEMQCKTVQPNAFCYFLHNLCIQKYILFRYTNINLACSIAYTFSISGQIQAVYAFQFVHFFFLCTNKEIGNMLTVWVVQLIEQKHSGQPVVKPQIRIGHIQVISFKSKHPNVTMHL